GLTRKVSPLPAEASAGSTSRATGSDSSRSLRARWTAPRQHEAFLLGEALPADRGGEPPSACRRALVGYHWRALGSPFIPLAQVRQAHCHRARGGGDRLVRARPLPGR